MSGRGRGRGRGRGAVPPSVASAAPFSGPQNSAQGVPKPEPGPTYPKVSLPEPIDAITEADKQLIKYGEELSHYMRSSPFFLSLSSKNVLKVDRYSDKYLAHLKVEERKGKIFAIDTDISFFPEELQTLYDPEKAKKLASLPHGQSSLSFTDALAKLKQLEQNESESKTGSDKEDEENEDEVVYDEEEFEDETDYNFSYFDNGEDYGDHDDGDEGPVY